MSALRRSRPLACHHASIHDLPDPVLARIFSFLGKRDSMSVLLVSKAWLSVAGEHCGALWDSLQLDGDRVCLEGALAKRDFQSGFKKRAANVSTLHVLGCKDAFTELLPNLLQALVTYGGSRLQELHLEVEFWRKRQYAECCKAVGQLTALRQLGLKVTSDYHSGRRAEPLLLAPLLKLSSLSCLEGLAVGLPYTFDDAPVFCTLLPSLASLTQLDLDMEAYSPVMNVCWLHPDGSGPSLRHIRLMGCNMHTPEGGAGGSHLLLRSLRHAERLELVQARAGAPEQLADVLPQLPALTSLVLERVPGPADWEQRAVQAALQCPHLQELSLALHPFGSGDGLQVDAPPGSLQQLTKLVVRGGHRDAPPAWSLPQLRHLHVRLQGASSFSAAHLQALGLNQSVEELELCGDVNINQATQAISGLTSITRLSICALNTELHGGPYLVGLKELALKQSNYGDAYHPLPPALKQATALELLDLSGDRWLLLRKQDADLLAQLPSLKAVYLPVPGPGVVGGIHEKLMKHNAAVVKHIQEELVQGGVMVQMMPLWQEEERSNTWSLLS